MFRHIRNVRRFFSDYFLGTIFGHGEGRGRKKQLSDRETDTAYNRFRRLYQRVEGQELNSQNTRERFIRPLLRDILGFHLGAGQESVYPLFQNAEEEQSGHSPILLAYCGASDEDPDKGHGNSAPMKVMERALSDGVEHGFLITAERFRFIRAAGDGPKGAYLEADLPGLAAEEDQESFAAFYRLFHASKFLPDERGEIPINEVERLSREHAKKVSEDLRRAVFDATEILVAGLLKDAVQQGSIPDLLRMSDSDLCLFRDAGLTALYRILFILYAEARDTRLDSHKVYRDAYSVYGLVEEILRDPSRKWPENRAAYWERLLAVFNIYDQGLPAITPWENIPPRGGDFFNAETPAGELLGKARLSDLLVAELLLALTTTVPRLGVGRERVSFRELDIESLGAVYEGLLEYEPRIAREIEIEVRLQGKIFALPPTEVVRLCAEKKLKVIGDLAIVAGTEAESLHPDASIEEEEAESEDLEVEEPETEDENGEDEAEDKGVKKGSSAKLLRRLSPGDFHFVPGSARKGSGSYYTPTELVQDLINHTLGPLAKGKSSEEILRLRVLDPACGSAHFLVEAMRFLGKELHRALVQEQDGKKPEAFQRGEWDSHWEAGDEEARAANSEARAWCKRQIAEHCLFGVDLNPTAVALARVALWIESLAGDRPLSYFEHHIRCGNSLLGTWLSRLDQPPLPNMPKAEIRNQSHLFGEFVRNAVQEAAKIRRMIDEAKPDSLQQEGIDPETIQEQEFKETQRRKANQFLQAAHLLFDLRSASAFLPEIWRDWANLCGHVENLNTLTKYAHSCSWWPKFQEIRNRERFFHWELEFPEIFFDSEHSGFDAVIGNPPWDQLLPTKKEFYSKHDVFIRAYKGNELDERIRELHSLIPGLENSFILYRERTVRGVQYLRQGGDFPLSESRSQAAHEDISKYFCDRCTRVARESGLVGLILPSLLYNGDACVGIRKYLFREATIKRFYAFENRKKIFPIDSRYKFVSLVFAKRKPNQDDFEAAFMRHDLLELTDHEPKPWVIKINFREAEQLSPETLALLEYRAPRDQEIVRKIFQRNPALGFPGKDGWGAELVTDLSHDFIFNSSRDKDLFSDPNSHKLFAPEDILGTQTESPPDRVISEMRQGGFWPVLEGKSIDQFLIGTKPIRWWLSTKAAQKKYGRVPDEKPWLIFRATASNTNERTLIAALLPTQSVGSHSLSGIRVAAVNIEVACTVLNSFCFDYLLRLRTAGTNIAWTYLGNVSVPPPEITKQIAKIATGQAWGKSTKNISDSQDTWAFLWSANKSVAEAYGLTPVDFEYILDSFSVFARKRPEFHAYLRERLAEWKSEVGVTRKVISAYPLPTSLKASQAAESAASYGKAVAAAKPENKHATSEQFRQAAVFAWVVSQLFQVGHPVSRYRAGKIIYLIERATELGLFKKYLKQAAGPYDPGLRYKGPEEIAVKQHKWLTAVDSTHFQPGSKINDALKYAETYLDTAQASTVIEEFRTYQDETLSRWTTVDFAARELQTSRKAVSADTIRESLRSSPEWAHKNNQREFTPELITRTLAGLRKMGFLSDEELEGSSNNERRK